MSDLYRRNHYDVTDKVFVADPRVVCDSVRSILQPLYPTADLAPLRRSFALFGRLFAGALPGYSGCETPYHDVQHSLDCALTFTRLLDGYERSVPMRDRLGPRRGVVGVITALFHDAGYIRRDSDTVQHGAELTRVHVGRSGEFLGDILPQLGFAAETPMVRQIVHYTGYEVARNAIEVHSERDHRLGSLLGTADILAQMSDRCYLEKCRDFLYREFEMCGLAGQAPQGAPKPVYASAEDLLRRTGDFRAKLWADRMDGWFEGVYRYAAVHFGGSDNPYLDAIESHVGRLAAMPDAANLSAGLRRRAESVDAAALRNLLSRRPRRSVTERRWPQISRRSRKTALLTLSANDGVLPCA